jgi:hypothetical protein
VRIKGSTAPREDLPRSFLLQNNEKRYTFRGPLANHTCELPLTPTSYNSPSTSGLLTQPTNNGCPNIFVKVTILALSMLSVFGQASLPERLEKDLIPPLGVGDIAPATRHPSNLASLRGREPMQ